MGQRLLTYEELDSICLNFIKTIESFSPLFGLFYNTAYALGTRFTELTEINRFSIIKGNVIAFQPAKGNNMRFFDLNQVPAQFEEMIRTQNDVFSRINYETSRQYILRHWPFWRVYYPTFTKELGFYMFRYRYIWGLARDGHNIQYISDQLGEIENTNTYNYVNQALTYWPPNN